MFSFLRRFVLSEEEKEAVLLSWFVIHKTHKEMCSMEEFDKEYKRLIGHRPLWYTWKGFYRDHGFVGMRPYRLAQTFGWNNASSENET